MASSLESKSGACGDRALMAERIFLSPPHLAGGEMKLLTEAVGSNWIAPLGPQVDAFEAEFGKTVGSSNCVALSSGTAGIHLALKVLGVSDGDEVFCSTLTFVASANPILYERARPFFIDSEAESWNMAPDLLAEAIESRRRSGKMPKAVILVHLYGQAANLDPILSLCAEYGIPVIEDAAEALGATYRAKSPGTFGRVGIFSFNGNKIITCSGGGMLVSPDRGISERVRFLATQARDPAAFYQHSQLGYNYRLSNLLAAVGRAQLTVLNERVAKRRKVFEQYCQGLEDVPGITFMPEAAWGRSTRWLTCVQLDANEFGADIPDVLTALAKANIEARPLWKPMHLQPLYQDYGCIGGAVAERLFRCGICLPSGSNLGPGDQARVISVLRELSGA